MFPRRHSKWFKLPLVSIIVLVFYAGCNAPRQQLEDTLIPQRLLAGQPLAINIDDLFYTTSQNISFQQTEGISAGYDQLNRLLTLQPEDSASGVFLVPFKVDGGQYHLPVFVDQQYWHHFRYRPDSPIEKAAVFGAFNSWNRQQWYMTDPDGDGDYTVRIPIEPGRYEYKFFVDGKELIDPSEPGKSAQPFRRLQFHCGNKVPS